LPLAVADDRVLLVGVTVRSAIVTSDLRESRDVFPADRHRILEEIEVDSGRSTAVLITSRVGTDRRRR